MESLSAANDKKKYQLIHAAIGVFNRNQRVLVPTAGDYEKAGLVLAELGWPASKKSNDVLMGVCARKIGAELWTCDASDFASVAKSLSLVVRNVNLSSSF